MTQWVGLFAVKAEGASLNLHVCQEPREALKIHLSANLPETEDPDHPMHVHTQALVHIQMYVQHTTHKINFKKTLNTKFIVLQTNTIYRKQVQDLF